MTESEKKRTRGWKKGNKVRKEQRGRDEGGERSPQAWKLFQTAVCRSVRSHPSLRLWAWRPPTATPAIRSNKARAPLLGLDARVSRWRPIRRSACSYELRQGEPGLQGPEGAHYPNTGVSWMLNFTIKSEYLTGKQTKCCSAGLETNICRRQKRHSAATSDFNTEFNLKKYDERTFSSTSWQRGQYKAWEMVSLA